jgi:uncharacterized membrane protein
MWEPETGWRLLYEESGGSTYAISTDGTAVVGDFIDTVNGRRTNRPYRWTEETGLVDLGFFPDGTWTGTARAVSGDGSVIVGRGGPRAEVFIWDEQHGLREIRSVMEELGIDLSDWSLLSNCYGISDDGKTFVGYGYHNGYGNEGWVAHIPEPNSALLFLLGATAGIRLRRR